jgi:hypothetical protein
MYKYPPSRKKFNAPIKAWVLPLSQAPVGEKRTAFIQGGEFSVIQGGEFSVVSWGEAIGVKL